MSAEPIELRIVRLETEVKRIDVTLQAIAKLTELTEGHTERLYAIESTLAVHSTKMDALATKQELSALAIEMHKGFGAMHKEFTAQTRQFVAWIAIIAGMAVAALKYLP